MKGILIKLIKDGNSRFDDYSISLKAGQVLFYWGYGIVESYLLWFMFFVQIKMSYSQFNRNELVQKAKTAHLNCGGKKYLLNFIFKRKLKKQVKTCQT